MNLLLLLSAMLSALTGIGGSARAPEATAAIAAKVEITRVVRNAVVMPPARPVQATPTLGDSVRMPLVHALTLAAGQPLYASRRRE